MALFFVRFLRFLVGAAKTPLMDKKRQEQCLRIGRLNIYCIDQISLSDNLSQWNGYHGLCIGSFLSKNYTVFTKEVKLYVKFR